MAEFIYICQKAAQHLNIDLTLERRGGGSDASLIQSFNPNVQVLDEFVYKDSIISTIDYVAKVILEIQNNA